MLLKQDLKANFELEGTKAERFLEDPDKVLEASLLILAKNFNYFGAMDRYLKQVAKLLLSLKDQSMANRL